MTNYPKDWPGEGPINLDIHDLPHHSSTTEWWYMNSHMTMEDGRPMSMFASFFRILTGHDKETKLPKYAHSLTWALVDPQNNTYIAESHVDKSAPKLGLERMDRGEGTHDVRLRRAMREVLVKGKVPYPDQMFEGDVEVALDKLHLNYCDNLFFKQEDGTYKLKLYGKKQHVGCELVFTLEKPPIRHGDNGVVKGTTGEDMFYYFIPRCKVEGKVIIDDVAQSIAHASGWYDHEFGCPTKKEGASEAEFSIPEGVELSEAQKAQEAEKINTFSGKDVAWNWASMQFEDGTELTAYDLFDIKKEEDLGAFCVLIDQEGNQTTVSQFSFTPLNSWRSTRTFHEYPTQWILRVPELGFEVKLTGSINDQEFITLISKPAFWEGRIDVEGTRNGEQVKGTGFIERSGFHEISSLDDFFTAVGKETRKSVSELIPFGINRKQARGLIASDHRDDLMEGVDLDQFSRTMIKPVREITDRGGKSWRSYASLACCDVVGGDSRKYVQWLAMPELMHVGSLIVDDVQDKSTWRRGGQTCHMIYGEDIAVNAGTACYFMGQKLLINKDNTSDADQLRLYDLYFQALRAGHAGQALDLEGPADVMDQAVEEGNATLVEPRVLAIHKLKTAVPAGSLARMGAVAGGGTDEQVEAVGQFFESVGLAFQIIDDVLNLRGFKGDLKSRGEDIMHGKVTMPVCKALGKLPLEDRKWLWDTIKSKPQEAETVSAVIEKLESCGAIEDCITQSSELVENAWLKLDPVVEDSLQKLMLRAFGWYVLERHY